MYNILRYLYATLIIIIFFPNCKSDLNNDFELTENEKSLVSEMKKYEFLDNSKYHEFSEKLAKESQSKDAKTIGEINLLISNFYQTGNSKILNQLEDVYSAIEDDKKYEDIKIFLDVLLCKKYILNENYTKAYSRFQIAKKYILNPKYDLQRKIILNSLTFRLKDESINLINYEASLKKTLQEFENHEWDYYLFLLNMDLVELYLKQGETILGKNLLQEILKKNDKAGFKSLNQYVYFLLYSFEESNDKKTTYLQTALNTALETNSKGEINNYYTYLGHEKINMHHDFGAALDYYLKALAVEKQQDLGNKTLRAEMLIYVGWANFRVNPKQNIAETLKYFKAAIENEPDNIFIKKMTYERMLWCYEVLNDKTNYDNTFSKLTETEVIYSILNKKDENIKTRNLLNFEYNDYSVKNLVLKEEVENEKKNQIRIASILSLFLLIAVFISYNFYSKRKLLQLDLSRKNELIDSFQDEKSKLIAKLDTSNENLDSFTKITSNDIQKPLITILENSFELKNATNLKPTHKKNIDNILSESLHLNNLVTNIFSFYNLTKDLPKPETIDLNKIIREIHTDTLKKYPFTNSLIINCEDLPILHAHNELITLLFENFISNCIKYKKEDTDVIINIKYKKITDDFYEFQIKDNGIGIQPEVLSNIFHIIKSENENSFAKNKIGLNMCKKIIEFYNGKIQISATENIGTSVNFSLPTH